MTPTDPQGAGETRTPSEDALLARVAPRTTTYPHDCGCETCPEHTEARATPPAAETGEPVAWMVTAGTTLATRDLPTVLRHKADAEWHQERGATVIPLYAAPAPREVSEASDA